MVAKDEQEHIVGQIRRAEGVYFPYAITIRQINKHTKVQIPLKFSVLLFRTSLLNIQVLYGETELGENRM